MHVTEVPFLSRVDKGLGQPPSVEYVNLVRAITQELIFVLLVWCLSMA